MFEYKRKELLAIRGSSVVKAAVNCGLLGRVMWTVTIYRGSRAGLHQRVRYSSYLRALADKANDSTLNQLNPIPIPVIQPTRNLYNMISKTKPRRLAVRNTV